MSFLTSNTFYKLSVGPADDLDIILYVVSWFARIEIIIP